MNSKDNLARLDERDAGQASALLLMMLSTFMLGVLGFAVDLTGLWFHRQAAQSAADAACLAGASDMLAIRAGVTPPGSGFTPGTPGNCADSSSAPLCKYAGFNGYSGTGLSDAAASNSVSWTFPANVSGVTSPGGTNPFLQVNVVENVKTYFAGLIHGSGYQKVAAISTCGVALVKSAPPVVLLNPNASGALNYTGSPTLNVVGGPSRSLQVNSSSATAVQLTGSGGINFSAGGPNFTGSDLAIYGGPATPTAIGNSNPFNGGTTGHWSSKDLPTVDPFGSVSAPDSVKSVTPQYGNSGRAVAYGTDGCPDNGGGGCVEFFPGYYPSGISVTGSGNSANINGKPYNTSTLIFAPGIYYMNGSVGVTGSGTLRMAKPAGYQRTDGVMFYFLTGSLSLTGSSGTNPNLDNVAATDLSCDGSAPPASLNMPSAISGNVLWAQCTDNGTYWDSGNDTTDARGTASRGILLFADHTNSKAPYMTASGNLGFAGSLYFHANNYASMVNLAGSGSTGTFIIGLIIADELNLMGSGSVNLALNPAKTIDVEKVALLQ